MRQLSDAAAAALHLANQSPQQQMYSALAHTPPSMTPGPNPQSPQASFPSAQQTVYIHPQQVQHGYNHNHMAHVQQVGHKLNRPLDKNLPNECESGLFSASEEVGA